MEQFILVIIKNLDMYTLNNSTTKKIEKNPKLQLNAKEIFTESLLYSQSTRLLITQPFEILIPLCYKTEILISSYNFRFFILQNI